MRLFFGRKVNEMFEGDISGFKGLGDGFFVIGNGRLIEQVVFFEEVVQVIFDDVVDDFFRFIFFVGNISGNGVFVFDDVGRDFVMGQLVWVYSCDLQVNVVDSFDVVVFVFNYDVDLWG